MSTIAAIAGCVTAAIGLAAILVKYVFSDDAAKAKAEAAFQAAEKAKQDAVASQVKADQQNAATASQGANSAADAAQAETDQVLKGMIH